MKYIWNSNENNSVRVEMVLNWGVVGVYQVATRVASLDNCYTWKLGTQVSMMLFSLLFCIIFYHKVKKKVNFKSFLTSERLTGSGLLAYILQKQNLVVSDGGNLECRITLSGLSPTIVYTHTNTSTNSDIIIYVYIIYSIYVIQYDMLYRYYIIYIMDPLSSVSLFSFSISTHICFKKNR